jgi:hypothetical protein
MPGCHVHPALNHDLLVVVVETQTGEEADRLDAAMASLDGVEGLALVSGFSEEP